MLFCLALFVSWPFHIYIDVYFTCYKFPFINLSVFLLRFVTSLFFLYFSVLFLYVFFSAVEKCSFFLYGIHISACNLYIMYVHGYFWMVIEHNRNTLRCETCKKKQPNFYSKNDVFFHRQLEIELLRWSLAQRQNIGWHFIGMSTKMNPKKNYQKKSMVNIKGLLEGFFFDTIIFIDE